MSRFLRAEMRPYVLSEPVFKPKQSHPRYSLWFDHDETLLGLKEFKRLGLYLRDKDRKLIRIDDPKLDPEKAARDWAADGS